MEGEPWMPQVRREPGLAWGGEVKRHPGEREGKPAEWLRVLWFQGKEWSLKSEPQTPMYDRPGTTFCCYSSLPGSSSLSSPSGNALVDFWAACIRVSMEQSWPRIACSERQGGKSLPIFLSLCTFPASSPKASAAEERLQEQA